MSEQEKENQIEQPDYPWDHDGEGKGTFSDEREDTGDEEDCYDNIAGILRYTIRKYHNAGDWL